MNVKASRQRIQTNNSKTPIILVVENDPDNLLLISHTLIFFKYTFITTTRGQNVLDLASKYHVDLILLDLILPDINGFDLISLLKKDQATQSLPIVVVSSLVRKQEQEKAFAAGCNAFLNKPYLIEDLDFLIRQYLSRPLVNYQSAKEKFLPFNLFNVS